MSLIQFIIYISSQGPRIFNDIPWIGRKREKEKILLRMWIHIATAAAADFYIQETESNKLRAWESERECVCVREWERESG